MLFLFDPFSLLLVDRFYILCAYYILFDFFFWKKNWAPIMWNYILWTFFREAILNSNKLLSSSVWYQKKKEVEPRTFTRPPPFLVSEKGAGSKKFLKLAVKNGINFWDGSKIGFIYGISYILVVYLINNQLIVVQWVG